MSSVGFVGLVKNVDALRRFVSEVNGAKQGEFADSRKRLGITKERVFLGQTPMGPAVYAYTEGLNAGFAMARMRSSTLPFDKYFLETMTTITGRNLADLPAGPPPHLAFEWTNGKRGKSATMIGAPTPDASKFWQLCREMTMRYGEHAESRESHGITFERVFYMHDAKMVAVYIEGDDPAAAMEQSMKSTSAYDQWFMEATAKVHGIDFRAGPPPRPEQIVTLDL